MKTVLAAASFCLLPYQATAADTPLFPSETQAAAPVTRVDNAALPPIEPAPSQAQPSQQVDAEMPPSRGPLRVVIPNIQKNEVIPGKQSRAKREKPVTPKPALLPEIQEPQQAAAPDPLPLPVPVEMAPVLPAPTLTAPAIVPAPVLAAPPVVPMPVATQTTTQPEQKDPANGLIFSRAQISASAIYSNVANLLAIPASWVVSPDPVAMASADGLADLMPAAGGTPITPEMLAAAKAQQEAAQAQGQAPASAPVAVPQPANTPPIPPSGPNGVMIYPIPSAAPVPKAIAVPFSNAASAQPVKAAPNNAPAAPVILSEPKQQGLSSQSKAILNKLPPVTDRAPKEKPGSFNIEREHAKPELGGDVQVSTESKGIKVDVKRQPMDVSYQLERAYNALLAGRSEDAIKIYEDVLTNDPNNNDALFGLASTYHRVGRLDLARNLYGKLLARNPNHRDGLNNFLVLLAEEAPEEALAQMQRLEEKNPGFSPIPAQMAVIYKKLGKTSQAIDKMYHALALSPENVTYRYNLAVMLDGAGERDKAAALYEQVLSAGEKGEVIPGDPQKIQQRLTFIRSNTHR